MIKSNSNNGNKKLVATFLPHGKRSEKITIKGKVAKTLIALITKKKKGCTALEISSWAFRLSSYIHILRTKYFFNIITQKEPHKGGWHARYFLIDVIKIIKKK